MQDLYEVTKRDSYVHYGSRLCFEKTGWNSFSSRPVSNGNRSMPNRDEVCGVKYLQDGWDAELEGLFT